MQTSHEDVRWGVDHLERNLKIPQRHASFVFVVVVVVVVVVFGTQPKQRGGRGGKGEWMAVSPQPHLATGAPWQRRRTVGM